MNNLSSPSLNKPLLTGDAVMFSNNCPTGFVLRTLSSSEWNHGAVAVRFLFREGVKEISLTEEGELYFFETNTCSRYDDFASKETVGVGFSRSSWSLQHYNRIAVRRLRKNFRTSELARRTLQFAQLHHGLPYPTTTLSFLPALTGVSFFSSSEELSEERGEETFCSQLMAAYYFFAVGSQYSILTGNPFDRNLKTLFGKESPEKTDMFTPGHFSSELTPSAAIFERDTEDIYLHRGDIVYVLLQPVILIMFVIVIFFYSLPK